MDAPRASPTDSRRGCSQHHTVQRGPLHHCRQPLKCSHRSCTATPLHHCVTAVDHTAASRSRKDYRPVHELPPYSRGGWGSTIESLKETGSYYRRDRKWHSSRPPRPMVRPTTVSHTLASYLQAAVQDDSILSLDWATATKTETPHTDLVASPIAPSGSHGTARCSVTQQRSCL